MTFTQAQLREKLANQGIPVYQWQLADSLFESVSAEFVAEVWDAWVSSLRRNAPELVTTLQLGGGKSRIIPRWIEEAGDCDNASFCCFAHAITGNWINAARGGAKVGRAFGVIFYTAEPRSENRQRAGGHAILWFVDHAGEFRVFEPGDGDPGQLTLSERMSGRFGVAA